MNINQSVSLIMFAKYIQYIYYAIYKKKNAQKIVVFVEILKIVSNCDFETRAHLAGPK